MVGGKVAKEKNTVLMSLWVSVWDCKRKQRIKPECSKKLSVIYNHAIKCRWGNRPHILKWLVQRHETWQCTAVEDVEK